MNIPGRLLTAEGGGYGVGVRWLFGGRSVPPLRRGLTGSHGKKRVVPEIDGIDDLVDRLGVKRATGSLAVPDDLEVTSRGNDRLRRPSVPALIVLHREEEDHDGERKGPVPQHSLHG